MSNRITSVLETTAGLARCSMPDVLGPPRLITTVRACTRAPMMLAVTTDRIMAFGLVMAVFMALALPFASLLLLGRLRDRVSGRERLFRAALIMLVLPAALAFVVPPLFRSDYLRFVDQDQRYYTQFARACDSMISKRPPGTYEFLFVPATNVSLPKIIEAWHPTRVTFYQSGFDILAGSGRAAFVISWHRPEGETNLWALETSGEPPERRLYVERKL